MFEFEFCNFSILINLKQSSKEKNRLHSFSEGNDLIGFGNY